VEETRNPWLVLESISDQRIDILASDTKFIETLRQQLEVRKNHFQSETWFAAQFDQKLKGYIAYFSMEFGLSESLPIYSGGLGVLAGDHMKTRAIWACRWSASACCISRGTSVRQWMHKGNRSSSIPTTIRPCCRWSRSGMVTASG